MSILVKITFIGLVNVTGKCVIFTERNIKTLRGSSYNSYLIREGKNVLIDTVDHIQPRVRAELRREIDLNDIDYIIINHAEEDHAGALTELMSYIPDTHFVCCTTNAIDSINGHHHHPVELPHRENRRHADIGNGKQLIFIEPLMLHWPDSMMTYLTGDAVAVQQRRLWSALLRRTPV